MSTAQKKKLNVAVVAGGYSNEYPVSIRSARSILSWLDRELFNPYLVIIKKEKRVVEIKEETYTDLDLSSFGFMNIEGKQVKFDYAFITIHGTPGEDGKIQGYLDIMGVPYNTGGVLQEALTFDKYTCNLFLSNFPGIRIARSKRLSDKLSIPSADELIREVGLPVFVKPNAGGSSIATTRVDEPSQLQTAIKTAFEEADSVMVEALINGTEVTCGCFKTNGDITPLPVTEVVTHNRFFDYDAKYNGAVEEITPARIPAEQFAHIQHLTGEIYKHLDTKGIIRVDYIIEADGQPTLLEVNTTPGMTGTSFIPQQVAAAGMNMPSLLTEIIFATIKM